MKRLAKIIGALFALIIVAALVAPIFINEETLKAQLVTQVKKATGRTLEIKGETSVRFLPNIAVSVADVTLSNPEGFTSPYLISLKKLSTGAQLRPLLKGELLIDGITLDGATINLEELASGAKNWEFTKEKLEESAEKAADAPEAQKNSGSPIKRFAMGDITISDSTINLIKPKAPVTTLDQINLSLQGADANSPLSLDGNARYRNGEISVSLDIADTKEFLNQKSSPLVASIKVPGGSIDFKGEASMGDAIAAKGKLNGSIASLPSVMKWATGNEAAASLPKQIAIVAQTDYSDKTLTLSDATFRADSTEAKGRLIVNHAAATPKISGTLDLGKLDLDAITSAGKSSSGATGSSAPANDSWSTTPIDLSGLKAANADLNVSWEQLTSGKFLVGPTSTHVALNGGKLALTVKESKLYNGGLSGVVRATQGGIGADLTLTAIDIEALMTALSGKSRLEGKTNLTLNVNATGNSQAAWVNSLNGKGALKVVDGAIKGINIGSFLRNAKQGKFFTSDSESTDFTELTATFTIASGVLNNSDLAMKSPALRLGGSGSANLPNKTINYRLVPTIAQTSKGQGGKDAVAGLTIPLVISGPWASPSVTPDLAGMAQEALRDPEALKQNLQNLKEGYKNFNSPSDIGKALLGGGAVKETTAPTATDAAPATDIDPAVTDTAPAAESAPLTEKEQRQKAIQDGIGGLLKGL